MTDHRSAEAQAYRHLYKSKAWRNGRELFLAQHPLCCICERNGRTTAANTVDHIKPHKGDLALFFSWSNWQSLCAACHSRHKQSEEHKGFSTAIGLDGWPTDPRHAANRTR